MWLNSTSGLSPKEGSGLLVSALVALWATKQTVNLMTLGGLALAVGILVDEAFRIVLTFADLVHLRH